MAKKCYFCIVMGTKEKLIERFKFLSSDFTFDELERLLKASGYERSNKGRTSGSRIIFKDASNSPIMLHKPHPGNIVKEYALKQVFNELKRKFDMNTLTYKGFLGTVSFSEKDSVFFGKIEGIDGLVNFEGESVRELTKAFHDAVDDYVAYCEENKLPLHKSYSGNLNIRINPETHSRLALFAKKSGVTLNALISRSLDSVASNQTIR